MKKMLFLFIFILAGVAQGNSDQSFIYSDPFGSSNKLTGHEKNEYILDRLWGNYQACLLQLNKPIKPQPGGYNQTEMEKDLTSARLADLLGAMLNLRAFVGQNSNLALSAEQKTAMAKINAELHTLDLHYKPGQAQALADFCSKIGREKLKAALQL